MLLISKHSFTNSGPLGHLPTLGHLSENIHLPTVFHLPRLGHLPRVGHLPKLRNLPITLYSLVLEGSPSRDGDVAVYVFNVNQPSWPTPFHSVVSISVFMTLSPVFHCRNSLDNFPFSHFVLHVLFLPYWPFRLYISMKVSFNPDIILCG